MQTITRIISIACLLALVGAFAGSSAGDPHPAGTQAHQAGFQARITLPDGAVQTARLDGLGCTAAICSRVAIQGRARGVAVRFWLDRVTAIKAIDVNDALVVMRDGTEQRITLVTDFRVLYLGNRSRGPERLDLARIKSLEFLPPGE